MFKRKSVFETATNENTVRFIKRLTKKKKFFRVT